MTSAVVLAGAPARAQGAHSPKPAKVPSKVGLPWLDAFGAPMFGASGLPLHVPHGFDVDQVLLAGHATSALDLVGAYRNLAKFAQGAAWDLQRLSGRFVSRFVDSATVLIGAYGASSGMSREALLRIASSYAALKSRWCDEVPRSTEFPKLPHRNVMNTDIGYALVRSGRLRPKTTCANTESARSPA